MICSRTKHRNQKTTLQSKIVAAKYQSIESFRIDFLNILKTTFENQHAKNIDLKRVSIKYFILEVENEFYVDVFTNRNNRIVLRNEIEKFRTSFVKQNLNFSKSNHVVFFFIDSWTFFTSRANFFVDHVSTSFELIFLKESWTFQMKQTLIIVDEIDVIYTKFNRFRKFIIKIDQQLFFQKNNIKRLEWNKMFKFSLDNALRRFDYLSTKLKRFRTHFQNQFKDFIDFIIDEIIQILKNIIFDIASINQKLYNDFANLNEQMQTLFNSQNFHKSITNQIKLYNNEIMRNLTHIIDAIIKRVNT